MKTVHRFLSLIACGLLFYIGVTGTLIQTLDLSVLLRHAPESNVIMQSINEGKFGNPPYAIVTEADFSGAALPANLDYARAFATVLAAAHGAKPDFAELRVAEGAVIGQVRFGKDVQAFDAATGAPVKAVSLQGARPPKSLRQQLKEWHRFWIRHDVPGVWIELFSGLMLWVLIVTGLVMYFRLYAARAKLDRRQPFWSAGGAWRTLHRWVSLSAAVFLIAVAFSGTWLGFESVWHTFQPRTPPVISAPLSDADILQMSAATLAILRRTEPQTPIRVLRVREYLGGRQGVVVTGGETPTRQLVLNLATGKSLSLSEPGYPPSGFPFGIQMHENIKHFHSGYMFGLPARFMDLLAGFALVFLSLSGLTLYVQLWLKRRGNGRPGLFWR